jgi:hypothetical protein
MSESESQRWKTARSALTSPNWGKSVRGFDYWESVQDAIRDEIEASGLAELEHKAELRRIAARAENGEDRG